MDFLSKHAVHSNTEAKRLSRQILNREINEIQLPGLSSAGQAESILQMLESLGANVQAKNIKIDNET